MMMATALIFPIALMMALGTIGFMLRAYGAKMISALRMQEPVAVRPAPLPPVRIAPRGAAFSKEVRVTTPALLAA